MTWFYVADPPWYLEKQDTPDKVWSNVIFLAVAAYAWWRGLRVLALWFVLLFVGSTWFHVQTSRETLAIDRVTMMNIFAYFFRQFWPVLPWLGYAVMGWLTVGFWYVTTNLLPYFVYQGVLAAVFVWRYRWPWWKKLGLTAMYVILTAMQLWNEGQLHSLKHVTLALLAVTLM